MKKISVIIAIIISIMLILTNCVNALTLVLTSTTDKTEYKVGEKINLVVSWSDGMQAVDMALKYDSSKVKFSSASIAATNYQDNGNGSLKVSWYTEKEEDCKSMTFVFEAIAEGEAKFSTDANELSFADGNLVQPDTYNASGMDKKVTIVTEETKQEETKTEENKQTETKQEETKTEENKQAETKQEANQENKTVSENNTNEGDSSKAPGSIPYTGKTTTTIMMVLLILGSIYGYIQIKKYKQI